MKKFKFTLIALALAASTASSAQAPAPMNPKADGIPVTKLSRLRVFADEQEMDQQSKLQYSQLLNEAKQKEALVPESDPQVKRLRAIAARIVPNAQRWNPSAANWHGKSTCSTPTRSMLSACRAAVLPSLPAS